MVPRSAKSQADARPLRGAGEGTIAGEPTVGHDPAPPASKAAKKRSILPLSTGAKNDDHPQAENDPRICRSLWPENPKDRRRELVSILPQAIREYFGNEAVIEYRLCLQEGELSEVAAENPGIAASLAKAKDLLCALAEDCLAVSIVNDRSSTDARYLLERLYPEKYARKSVSEKPNGRSYDLPADGPKSVLDSKPKPHSEVQ